jgi:hypothetical protein
MIRKDYFLTLATLVLYQKYSNCYLKFETEIEPSIFLTHQFLLFHHESKTIGMTNDCLSKLLVKD